MTKHGVELHKLLKSSQTACDHKVVDGLGVAESTPHDAAELATSGQELIGLLTKEVFE